MALGLLLAGLALLFWLLACVRVVNEYERAVLFTLGRAGKRVHGPGLLMVWTPLQWPVVVGLRATVLEVPRQDVITRDNVTLKVGAVVTYRVTDPRAAVLAVEDYAAATAQVAQTALRSLLGEASLDEVLAERDKLGRRLRVLMDAATGPWGIEVASVDLKSVDLPESIQRAMGRQAEAEREKRAKIIAAEGELLASTQLLEAAQRISQDPVSIQLRYLQTLAEISTERNSTIVFPLPMDFLRMLEPTTERRQRP